VGSTSPDTVDATHARLRSQLDFQTLPFGIAAHLKGGTSSQRVAQTAYRRIGGHLQGGLGQRTWQGRLRWNLSLRGDLLTDAGALFSARSDVEFRASREVAFFAGLGRHARPPTLGEMVAPAGLVLGNEDLLPERSTDGEIAIRMNLGRPLRATLALFGGQVEETIVFANRNAYEIQALNTGPLWRAGVEGRVDVDPHPAVNLSVVWSTLASKLVATEAPLPGAPAWQTRSQFRLGRDHLFHGVGQIRGQDSAPSNLFGTLKAPAYAMVDAFLIWPINRTLRVALAVTNIVNVLDARDVHQLPLPGRQFFLSFEVSA
jgi:outer membrane receptor protein involved in Fe transport